MQVNKSANHPLIGLANLTTQSFHGVNLTPTCEMLIERLNVQEDDAAALMDLATIQFLFHQPEAGMQLQAGAMAQQTRYSLSSAPLEPDLRMLALLGAGGLMDNLPLEFLLEGSAIAMDLHYMQVGAAIPQDLADYDLIFVAVGESDDNTPLLQQLAQQLQDCPVPVLNRPELVMQTTREAAATVLADAAGVMMPVSVRLDRDALFSLGLSEDNLASANMAQYLPGQDFPVIVRPVESHGGHGLARLDQPKNVAAYLAEQPEELFYISPFVNYASDDGQFRKYRVVLIEGEAFLCHLAISARWLVHYLNADMLGNAENCAEEARCMADFDDAFGRRHKQAFAAIYENLPLPYLIIDCAETDDGQLLVFEVDTSAIIHAMDPISIFPYKSPQMHKIFTAFQAMLTHRARA
ncbi:MAG: hypothetical protein R8K50_06380 [Mariprofundus sp.]